MANEAKSLSDKQKYVLKEKGTELPFSGALLHVKDNGDYTCANCGNVLFSSSTKFESNSGWPSFYDVAATGRVELIPDDTLGMHRTEVICAKCGSHLGHVFDDGPAPTKQRYCINSAALNFAPEDKSKPMLRGDGEHSSVS